MDLLNQLAMLVTDGSCIDASEEAQAVFDAGILVVVTANVVEDISSPTVPRLSNGNSPIEQLLLDIKNSFGKRMFLEDIKNIDEFLQRGREALVALPEIEDYLALVVPLSSIRTLFICNADESPEQYGIHW